MRMAARQATWLLALWTFGSIALGAQAPTTVSGVVTTRADGLSVPGSTVSLVGRT